MVEVFPNVDVDETAAGRIGGDLTMNDFQKRVVEEKAELDAKRERLGEFKNTIPFSRLPWQEQERLNTQAHIMTMYSAVLGERIAAFHDAERRSKDPRPSDSSRIMGPC